MHMPFSLPAFTAHDFFKISTAVLSVSVFSNSSWGPSQNITLEVERRPWTSPEHAFIAPQEGDVRSPCPGLNALANHGFINRSGRDISASSLVSSLTSIYHLSTPLASDFVSVGFLWCGNLLTGISLDALAAHNKIEHDASLVHDDAPPGAQFAPTGVDWELLDDLVTRYSAGMGIHSLAEVRVQREGMVGPRESDPVHEEIGHGEAAMAWLLMKEDGTDRISTQTLKEWLGHETFPEMYTIPDEEITLGTVLNVSAQIRKAMNTLKHRL
ncbi:Chloroperoxidase [Rhodocollybia butyracea]|uniref:Chloroperoxidase n=1 Tax=Rhodocollybia butyracea TaxID=206335 RepID=A0A9P5Q8G5_9AGAR|nr:Chloroperoxidase [Rhodocollybia butyracea]